MHGFSRGGCLCAERLTFAAPIGDWLVVVVRVWGGWGTTASRMLNEQDGFWWYSQATDSWVRNGFKQPPGQRVLLIRAGDGRLVRQIGTGTCNSSSTSASLCSSLTILTNGQDTLLLFRLVFFFFLTSSSGSAGTLFSSSMDTGTSGTMSGIGRTCSSGISRSTISLASWRASRSSPTCSAKLHDRWVDPRRLSLDAESLMSFMRVSGWADKFSMLSATLANESLRALFSNPWAKRKTAAFRPFCPDSPLLGSSSQWLNWSYSSSSSKYWKQIQIGFD